MPRVYLVADAAAANWPSNPIAECTYEPGGTPKGTMLDSVIPPYAVPLTYTATEKISINDTVYARSLATTNGSVQNGTFETFWQLAPLSVPSALTIVSRMRRTGGTPLYVLQQLYETVEPTFIISGTLIDSNIVSNDTDGAVGGAFSQFTWHVPDAAVATITDTNNLWLYTTAAYQTGFASSSLDISWAYIDYDSSSPAVVTAPFPPTLHKPYYGQTYGGTGVPLFWSYSTYSGTGSLTTPTIDISISTDCGTTWSDLTSSVDSTGYLWDSTSYLTVTNGCTRVRIRESNDTPSSWVTSGPLFPPRIWIQPPASTTTETWSLDSCSMSTWATAGCDSNLTWTPIGV